MSIKTILADGHGSGNDVKVSEEGQLNVVNHAHPPKGDTTLMAPVRQFFTNSAGSNDMQVDGSSANVEYTVDADPLKDIYIKTISFVIADAGATLNKFGNITALSNGCKLEWVTQDQGTVIISDQLTSNFEFVRLCVGNPGYGDGTGAFRASNVISTSEGYIPVLDVENVFGMRYGFKLRAGTTDQLKITIRDNTTGVDQFDAIAYGLKV